jgi:hypothetical protein
MMATQLHERDALDDRDARIAALEAELTDLRALLPPRPPRGWLNVKRAAEMARCSGSAIYKWARNGKLRSCKLRSRVWVDPASISTV